MRSYLFFGVLVSTLGCCAAQIPQSIPKSWYYLKCEECSCLTDNQPRRCIDYGKIPCPDSGKCEGECEDERCCCSPPPCSSGDCSCLGSRYKGGCEYNQFEYCDSSNKCWDPINGYNCNERRCCCQADIPPCETDKCACLHDHQQGECKDYNYENCYEYDTHGCCDPITKTCCKPNRCCCNSTDISTTTTTSTSTSTSTATTTTTTTTQSPPQNCTLPCTIEYECNDDTCFCVNKGQCEDHGYYKCCDMDRCRKLNPNCEEDRCCCKREQCGCDEDAEQLCYDRPCHWDNFNYHPFVHPFCERNRQFTCCEQPVISET